VSYVVKADIADPEARRFSFRAAKTMYGRRLETESLLG
jgi:hypothetical protein